MCRGASPGRPPILVRTIHLIRRMPLENKTWGAPRIQPELKLLGLDVSGSILAKYMPVRGPTGDRARRGTPSASLDGVRALLQRVAAALLAGWQLTFSSRNRTPGRDPDRHRSEQVESRPRAPHSSKPRAPGVKKPRSPHGDRGLSYLHPHRLGADDGWLPKWIGVRTGESGSYWLASGVQTDLVTSMRLIKLSYESIPAPPHLTGGLAANDDELRSPGAEHGILGGLPVPNTTAGARSSMSASSDYRTLRTRVVVRANIAQAVSTECVLAAADTGPEVEHNLSQ